MVFTMKTSTIGFKNPSADLHKKSRTFFLFSLILSIIFTTVILHVSLPHRETPEKKVEVPPVIIQLQNIPRTRQTMIIPAPHKPYIPGSIPIEVDDELIPDEITIEDTSLDLDTAPPAPPGLFIPGVGAAVEENEIFEYFSVEEKPFINNTIIPEYPEMAKRAGVEGSVFLKVLVNQKGFVDSVEVIEGPSVFHKSSIEAAKATTFTPAKHNDRPVSCWVIMPFRFVLEN